MANDGKADLEITTNMSGFRNILKEWWELFASITSAIAAALATILGAEGISKLLGFLIALTLIGVSAYIFNRTQKRRRLRSQLNDQIVRWEELKQKKLAFRGLYSFREGDVLPGEHRQREARTIFTQLTDPDFSFGVICGEVGCGKTSLLRSTLQNLLKESGFRVLYVGSLKSLSRNALPSHNASNDSKLQSELNILKEMIWDSTDGLPLIVIIDQMEEFFIDNTNTTQRAEVGLFIKNLINSEPRIKVICAIRRDYLIDMQDLAPNLPDPISSKTLFQLKNFTEDQATNVIEQCAHMDQVTVSKEFATILASDLAEGGFVRPPELQIVCTALMGDLNVSKYRLSGGAKGILSKHIENAISICSAPDVGRRILRVLCDYPVHAKREPQTISMIKEAIGTIPRLRSVGETELIETILRQFEAARIVISENRGSEESRFSLIHDYLIDSVSIATSDVSTRAEEASQLLQYYLSGARSGSKVQIPLLKRKLIKKYADRKLLASPQVKQLMRKSLTAQLKAFTAIILLISTVVFLVYAITTSRLVWRGQEVARHWSVGIREGFTMAAFENGLVVTQYSEDKTYVRLWEANSAKVLSDIECQAAILNSTGEFLIVAETLESTPYALHLPNGSKYNIPLDMRNTSPPQFGDSGSVITYLEQANTLSKEAPLILRIWSIIEQRQLGIITGFSLGPLQHRRLTKSADRVVMLCANNGTVVPGLWNVQNGQLLGYLVHGTNSVLLNFDLDEERSLIATLEVTNKGDLILALWDLATGKPIRTRNISEGLEQILTKRIGTNLEQRLFDTDIRFAGHGAYIILDQRSGDPLAIFNTYDLLQTMDMPIGRAQWINSETGLHFLIWAVNSTDSMIWDIRETKPSLVKNFSLPASEENEQGKTKEALVVIHRDGRHAIIINKTGKAELWDFGQSQKVKDLETTNKALSCAFTLDGQAACLRLEGNAVLVFSVTTGNKVADLQNTGGYNNLAFYDPTCHKIYIWNNEGRVLQFIEGNEILNVWFRPLANCDSN